MTNLATTSAYSFTIDPQLLFAAQNALTSTHTSQQTTTTMAMQMQRSRTYLNSSHSRTAPMCTFQEWTEVDQPGVFRIFTIISVLTILVMLVVLGNALVIAAVILRRRLRSATGLLILSLAVADLMVGLFILPFSIANEVLNSYWIFGDTWCTAWLTMDIWMCTASIYNLVAISIDRYIAIIKPLNYPMLITKFRARCIVAAVWIGSFIICSPSFLLASTERKGPAGEGDMAKLDDGCACNPSNSGMAYIVFSASSSFYIPMIIVIFVYVRIYIAACAATKSVYSGMMQVTATANKNPKNLLMQNPSALSRTENLPILRVHRGSTVKNQNNGHELGKSQSGSMSVPISISNNSAPTVYAQMNGSNNSLQYVKRSSRASRRHSEEEKWRFDGSTIPSQQGERQSPCRSPTARRSTGSIHNTLHESPTILLNETSLLGEELNISLSDHTPAISSAPRPSVISMSEQEKQRWFYGNNAKMTRIKEQRKESEGESEMDMSVLSNGDTHKLLHENTLQMPYYDADVPDDPLIDKTAEAPIFKTYTNDSSTKNETPKDKQCESNGDGGTTMATYLHPNSATKQTKKRKSYGNMITKIMRRGPKKKAGCAYEKRLSLEIKAAKTVAIVTGCFICCWLGFSILYGLSFTYKSNEVVWSIVFWLGYLNSALNPVIYTVFNREFRTCFKRLLTCNHLLFASRINNQNNPYNSYNSQLRAGKPTGYSSVSAPPYYTTRSSPPGGNSEDS